MACRLVLLVSVVALLPRFAEGQVAIGVLPVEVGGEIGAVLAPTLEASIASGLEAAGASVRAPEALARAAGLERSALAACAEAACLESLAGAAGVAALIRVTASEEYDIYSFSFAVFSAAGQSIGAFQEGCEVCTNAEAGEALVRAAEQVARDLPATGTLRISVSPEHAEVRVDGEIARDREISLSPGEHDVTVTAEGFRPREDAVTIHLGGVVQVSIVLEAEDGRGPRSEPHETMGAMGIAGWVLVGIGGAATVAGIVVAALDGRCAGGATDPQGDCELIYEDPTLAVGLGIVGGGVAVLATGLVLGLLERSRRRRDRPRVSLILDPGRQTSVLVSWPF